MDGINHKQCHHIYDIGQRFQDDDQSEPSTGSEPLDTDDTSVSKQTQDDSSTDSLSESDDEPLTEEEIQKPPGTTSPETGTTIGTFADDTDMAETLEVHSAHLPVFTPLEPTYTAHPWQHPTYRCDQAFHRRK